MTHSRKEGYSLALNEEGTIVMLWNAEKNQRWPKNIQKLNHHMIIKVQRKDGLIMAVPLGGLVDALRGIRSQDLEDTATWLYDLVEMGVLNDNIPHLRLSDLINVINVMREILIMTSVEFNGLE